LRWQKALRLAIAAFVVIFAAVVAVSFRRGGAKTAAPPPLKKLGTDVLSESGRGAVETMDKGKIARSITFGHNVAYADGRQKLTEGVKVIVPDKNGRTVTIESREADVLVPPGKQIDKGEFKGGVKLTTSDGVTVQSATASYEDATQITTIPGPVTFSKGRMTGSGVGATYDQNRGVLWLLADAKVDVTPDKQGSGAIHVTSKQAGMARPEHYMKFTGTPHMDGEGHVIDADDTTVYLTPDDERVTRMELRGNSSIRSKPGGGGPQQMRAKDIDLTYAEDGRTLQSAHLLENALVRLPGEKGKAGKQIAGKGIDVSLAPDGSTVTNLTASENVQVDLPADGDIPARRIRSAILIATGAPAAPGQPGGIKNATFGGGVEFRESRAAKGKLAAIDRTARSDKLEIQTKPGFGDLERAEFHNGVHFTDGPKTKADAPMAVYDIAQDRLDLSPAQGDTGSGPHVSDGRISIDAAHIQMGLSSQKMKADTNVRSVMIQQQGKSKDDTVKVPSMLKQDKPVNVKSNRLDYDSGSSLATYEGNARLWQDGDDGATILADKIVVDDNSGNLHAITNVTTSTVMKQAVEAGKPAPAQKPTQTVTKATEMLYEDAKHRAIYTGSVHMNGPDGDLTSDRLELYFTEQGGDLERAEAEGNVVSKQEARRAFGKHLSYDAKTDTYTMTGAPAMVYDDTPPNCKLTKAPEVKFRKESNTGSASGGTFGQKSEAVACGSGPGSQPAAETRQAPRMRM
jgi:lipopolysaccharide export system protein LptA